VEFFVTTLAFELFLIFIIAFAGAVLELEVS
jgi:hypothetical protein